MKEKHFFVVHSYIDDEAKKNYLTPPEKRDPPKKEKPSVNGQKEPLQENSLDVFRLGQQAKTSSIAIGSLQVKNMFISNFKQLT